MYSEIKLFQGFNMDLGEAALYAFLGLMIVFIILALLVLILTAYNYLIKKAISQAPAEKDGVTASEKSYDAPVTVQQNLEDDAELVAVITAAVTAAMEQERKNDPTAVKAPFVIRRIRHR